MTIIYSVLILTFAARFAWADEIRPIRTTQTDRAITASTNAGEVQLEARELQVEVLRPGDKKSTGALLVVFDRSSGLFARRFAWIPHYPGGFSIMANFLSWSKVYLTADKIVFFTNFSGGVSIREFTGKATSMDEAETRALSDSIGDLTDYVGKSTSGPGFSFDHHLGEDFSFEPGSSFRRPTRILGISQRDGKWEITVVGRGKAKVTLNEKYEVTTTERVQ
jgi:hypothetical protein